MRNYVESADIAKDSVCNPMTRKWLWLDLLGIGLAFFFIVFGELVWLPDPLRVGQHIYWIELMDEVVYLLILLPMFWALSAVLVILQLRKQRHANIKSKKSFIILFITRIVSLFCSILAVYYIIFDSKQLIWLILSLVIAWLMTIISMHLQEWIQKHAFPRRSFVILLASISFLALLLWPTSYNVTYPGLTMNMNQYAHVENGKSVGEISGVLIFERPAFPVDWIYAKLFSQYEFAKRIETQLSLGEQLQEVRTQQIDANQIASAEAFAKMGLGKGTISHGARVTGLIKDSPASKQLKLGDIIIQINEHSITTTRELINDIKGINPGSEIKLIVVRNKAQVKLTLLTKADPKDPKKAVIGVQITDEIEVDLPLKVDFHPFLLHVGGPSHGAMLTLAIIDQLTAGGVLHGNRVAGTGTIDSSGYIGPIGGIRQKAYTVERSKADVFFVPAEQLAEARLGADHLNMVPVQTIDDILKWLKEHPKRLPS